MKRLVLALLAAAIALPALSVDAQVRVKGYYRKDGTYVQPQYRSSPNSSTLDNYSTRGNVNPYTGKEGTRDPYAEPRSNPYSSPYRSPNSSPYSNPYAPRTPPPCYYDCPDD